MREESARTSVLNRTSVSPGEGRLPAGGQPFLQAFGYDVRGHAEPFSIPSLPIIAVSTLTLHTIGRFEGHVRIDNRKITQQANPYVVRL
jgi:hypothetical protein